MGANSELLASIRIMKKELKKIELLLEYKQKKKLINKIMDMKYAEMEESESGSESDSESESDPESESGSESGSEHETDLED
jgi:hypothetical protein